MSYYNNLYIYPYCLKMHNKCVYILLIWCLAGPVHYANAKVPKWPSTYIVKGIIEVPYAEIKEPFEAWYDESVGSSRVDYYNGTVKTYQLSGVGRYGTAFRIHPVVDKMMCFKTEGNKFSKITPEHTLPDLKGFEFVGKQVINGVLSEKWQTAERGEVKNMYLQWKEDVSYPGLKLVVPIRYETKGSDHYYMNFNQYSATHPPPDVFKISNDTKCIPMDDDLVYHYNPIHDLVSENTDHVDKAWRNYKIKFNKKYSIQEEDSRKMIFRKRMRYITSMNRANLNYTLAENHLADLTDEELRTMSSCLIHQGGLRRHGGLREEDYEGTEVGDPLPSRWDWRNRGAVTPVKDQSQCGSCWSFSSTGVIEGALFLKAGKLIRFSEQALIDCAWDVGNMGCGGGLPVLTFIWIKKNGIPIDEEYGPYLAQEDYCHLNKTEKKLKITSFRPVKPMCVDCIKRALIKNGPISVGISVSRSFMFYQNGVYDDQKCLEEHMSHAVLIVGYSTLGGQDYWIVKNSWSIYWGMNGYILMAIQGNTCHIMEELTIAKI